MTTLLDWQRRFHAALWADAPADADLAALAAQPGFAIYRNTVRKGCIDALEANYPVTARLVGSDWFRSAAVAFVRQQPPADARLMGYGEGFADFLAGIDSVAEGLPYLPGIARIERAWTCAHLAADAPVLAAAALAAQAPEQLGACVLRPHPSAHAVYDAACPVFSLWNQQRSELPAEDEVPWLAEGALLLRPQAAVQAHALGAAGHAFFTACAAGLPIDAAADAALQADTACDLTALIGGLLAAGAFTALEPAP